MKRKGLISVLALSAFGLGAFGAINFQTATTASAQTHGETATAWLADGGSVRFGDAGNGLRFTMQIRADAFDENATYGILIAPEDGYTLTEENVFGANAVYNWAVKNENGEWTYQAEAGKTQIVNLITEGFNDENVVIDGASVAVKEFYGSLIDLDEANYAREFRAVGYVRTGTEGNYDYTLVGDSDNVRSMAYIAQLAIEDTTASAPTAEQKQLLQTTYLDKVADVNSPFVQEYYLEQADGSFKKVEALTETLSQYDGQTTKIGTAVSFVGKEIEGYKQVLGKGALSGNVYANGKLVLKAYYEVDANEQELGLINVAETTSVSVSGLTGAEKKLYQVYGDKTVEISSVSGDTLDISALDGAYKVCGISEFGGVISSLSFDVYNGNEKPVWNNAAVEAVTLSPVNSDVALTKTTVGVATQLPENATGSEYYEVVGGAERYGFTLNGLHSKAYYEQFTGSCLYLTFEYYMSAESLDETVVLKGMQTGIVGTETWTDVDCGVWTKASVALETLLANWDEAILTIGDFYKSVNGETGAIVGGASAVKESHLYIGNFALEADLSNVEAIVGESRMVEVENGNYNLENLLSIDEAVQFAGFKGMGEVTWSLTSPGAVIELDSSVVDFSIVTKRIYTVKANIGETLLYTAEIDFYNENEFLWNDAISAEEVRLKEGKEKVGVSVVENPAGATGNYYQLTFGAEKSGAHFIYEPAHTKEYYALFYGQNISLALDYYLGVGDNYTNVTFCGYVGGIQRVGKKWHTELVSVDKLYDYWDKFNGSEMGWQGSLMQINTSLANAYVYVGNFRASLAVDGVVAETETRLIDVKGMETYLMSNVLESAGVSTNLYENKTVRWTLTPIFGGETVTVTDFANFYQVEKRAYNVSANLTVYGLQAPIYTGVIDFYDSDDGVVWNVSYNASDIVAKKNDTAVTGVATDPAGKTGKYYQIDIDNTGLSATFYPSHSKAYYSEYVGENLNLHLEFYFDANTEYLNTPLCNDSGINRKYKTWHEDSIPLDYLFTRWDSIMNPNVQGGWEQVIFTCANSDKVATFYFGNFHFEIASANVVNDATERLVNLNGETTYEMSKILAAAGVDETIYANQNVVWTLTPIYGGNAVVITGGVADFSKAQKIAYNAVASISKFNLQAPIYTGVVDFYDVNDGVVWNTLTNVNSLVLNSEATASIVDIATVSDVNANTGTFFESSAVSANKIMVMPEHTKGYYQTFLADGADYTLSYQFTFIAYKDDARCTYATGGHSTCPKSGSSHSGTSSRCDWYQFSSKAWKTVTYNLSALVSSWNSLNTKVFLSTGGTNYTVPGLSGGQSATECRIYVGDFQTAKIVTEE